MEGICGNIIPKKPIWIEEKKEAVCELCHKDMVNNHSCFVDM